MTGWQVWQRPDLPACRSGSGCRTQLLASHFVCFLHVEYSNFALIKSSQEGKAGEAVINQHTNGLALLFALYSGLHEAFELAPYAILPNGFVPMAALALIAGACIARRCTLVCSFHAAANTTFWSYTLLLHALTRRMHLPVWQ